MRTRTQTNRRWLAVLLLLAMLDAAVAALAVGPTYAARAEATAQRLTYTPGALTWDTATDVGPDGAALLDWFDASYQNVQAQNGDNLVAPGTETTRLVQLQNDASTPIRYVALLYCRKAEQTLPVAPRLTGTGFADTGTYPLPDGITDAQVVRAVTGTVAAGAVQDFTVTWGWHYYENDARDALDTALGNRAAFVRADEVTAGLYIVVEQESPADTPSGNASSGNTAPAGTTPGDTAPSVGSTATADAAYITPQLPRTGDDSPLALYGTLLAFSAVSLLLLWALRRKGTP